MQLAQALMLPYHKELVNRDDKRSIDLYGGRRHRSSACLQEVGARVDIDSKSICKHAQGGGAGARLALIFACS